MRIVDVDERLLADRKPEAVEVFRSVFGSPPHCEAWEAAAVAEELDAYVEHGVLLFVLSDDDRILALGASWPGSHSSYREYIEEQLADVDQSIDLAELCVLHSSRGQGVGAAVLDALLDRAGDADVFLRVALEAEVAKGMYTARGFTEIAGSQHTVSFPRVPGSRDSNEDERVILLRQRAR